MGVVMAETFSANIAFTEAICILRESQAHVYMLQTIYAFQFFQMPIWN